MKKILAIILTLLLCVSISACGGDSSSSDSPSGESSSGGDATTVDTSTEAYSVQLTSGNYTAGIDIPIGVYNITAISGSGNVSSSNMYDGGINAMMGIDDGTDMYEESFNNLDMTEDVILTVSGGVTIKLSSEAAQTKNMKKRTPEGAKCTLSSGNYTAGTDFEPGVYTITAVSGNGNVSSSNMYDGGLNAVMGTDTSMDFYEKKYKNVALPEGTTLQLSGVEVRLVPSK